MIAPLPLHVSFGQAMKAQPMLSLDEEIDLIDRAKAGESAAVDRIVLAHLRMVVSSARRFAPNADPNDLVQEGVLGLMRALESFKPGIGVRFSTYARAWMKERQIQHTQSVRSNVAMGQSHGKRRAMYHLNALMEAEQAAARARGENPTRRAVLEKAATKLNLTPADAEDVLARGAGDFSLNVMVGGSGEGNDTMEWVETLVGDEHGSEEAADRRRAGVEMDDLVRCGLEALNPRERRVVLDRHLTENPVTLETLGTRMGVSKERIRQIESAALAKMAKALGARKKHALSLIRKDS